MTRRRIILLAAGGVLLLVVALAGWQGARAWWAWRGIERIEFDTASARERLLVPLVDSTDDAPEPQAESSPAPTYQVVEYDAVLVLGSDERTNEHKQSREEAGLPFQENAYADAILLWLAPTDGGDPALVSIPRDLLVTDPCSGQPTKLDRTLAGCGAVATGPELVALAVEDYTGITIDHFATFGFSDFVDVIDSLGGVELCVDYALRQGEKDLLPAGCSVASGEDALAWVRSRGTQEFVDGEWRFIEGVADSSRSERQQQLLFAMLARLKAMRSPAALAGIAESVGDTVVLSASLSMGDAVAMAWDLRSTSAGRIRRLIVPTEPAVTADGSFALRAVVPFRELLEE